MSVHKKLMQARIELQGKTMSKSGLNKFAGYTYFELSDFLPTVQKIFNELGLCGVISFATDVATLTITDVDGGGEIKITSPMADAQLKGCHPIQNLGAVETYLRRYLWVTALEIVEHDAVERIEKKRTRGSKDDPVIVTPTKGIGDELPLEEKQYLQELAIELIATVNEGNPRVAYERLESENLDDVQKPAIWSLLDSKTRSAIKTAKNLPL